MHVLICLNEIEIRLADVNVINFSELLLPDHFIVVKGALLFIRIEMQTEERLDSLQKVSQRFHIELRGRLVHSFIVRIILVLIRWVGSRVHSFCLNRE